MATMGLVFVLFPRQIARIFTPDPTVISVGAKLLLVAAAFQLFDGLQTVATGSLRGSGERSELAQFRDGDCTVRWFSVLTQWCLQNPYSRHGPLCAVLG